MNNNFLLLLLFPLITLSQSMSDSIQVRRVQRSLFIHLGGWAGAGIATGTWQTLSRRNTITQYMGYQNLAWGGVNAAITVIGAISSRKQAKQMIDWSANKQRLRRWLWINAGLDLGYMAVGTFLATRPDPRLKGTGYGVILQGGGLFVLDAWHALRLR
ncbi:MAG: hypothetical protein N2170_00715 [Bacteroidia bacterium]|nr:hypothetical protein [Bacteroidia bacterium]